MKFKIRDAPDTDFAGYPAKLKAGYRISGAGRVPDIRPDIQIKTFECPVKYEIKKNIISVKGFFFSHTSNQAFFYIKAVT
jgi:hypothetical protein